MVLAQPTTAHGAYHWWNQNLDFLQSVKMSLKAKLSGLKWACVIWIHTYGWFVFGRAFPKCAFSLHVADERRRTFGHSEVWKARRNQEYLEAPETFWKLGMWELRRLLSNSSVSLGRCFARSGPICSAHCATRSAGPWSLPVNISTSDVTKYFFCYSIYASCWIPSIVQI